MAIDILPGYTAPVQTKEDEFHGTEGNYLLPHHAEEIKRLQRQHEFIKSSTKGALTSLCLPRNARVLDSGCADGRGFLSSLPHRLLHVLNNFRNMAR